MTIHDTFKGIIEQHMHYLRESIAEIVTDETSSTEDVEQEVRRLVTWTNLKNRLDIGDYHTLLRDSEFVEMIKQRKDDV